jgi:hypothetical protein
LIPQQETTSACFMLSASNRVAPVALDAPAASQAHGVPPCRPSIPRLSPSPCRQVGCGADELIDLLMRCVLEPGDTIVDCPPTFTMYAFDAAVNAAGVVTVPRLDGFKIDVEGKAHCVVFAVSVVCTGWMLRC